MAKMIPLNMAVPAIMAALTIGLVFYLIMVYPEERVNLLGDNVSANIEIKNNEFLPSSWTIRAGKTVTWKNSDTVKHRITGMGFTSGVLNPGEFYSHKFSAKGVYDYSCEFHPGMKGTVIVT